MKFIVFIQTNDGRIHYKCDSFWTTSTSFEESKVYDMSTAVDPIITAYDYNMMKYLERVPEKLDDIISQYHECKMGYILIDDIFLSDGKHSIKLGTSEDKLGQIQYTHEMIINGTSRPSIVDVRRKYMRDEKLTEILK